MSAEKEKMRDRLRVTNLGEWVADPEEELSSGKCGTQVLRYDEYDVLARAAIERALERAEKAEAERDELRAKVAELETDKRDLVSALESWRATVCDGLMLPSTATTSECRAELVRLGIASERARDERDRLARDRDELMASNTATLVRALGAERDLRKSRAELVSMMLNDEDCSD